MPADAPFDVAARLGFATLLSRLATGFVNVPADRLDVEIRECLRRLVEALDIERGNLLQVSAEGDDLILSHSWARPGFVLAPDYPGFSAREILPWTLERALQGE